jgi:hypothetical protein
MRFCCGLEVGGNLKGSILWFLSPMGKLAIGGSRREGRERGRIFGRGIRGMG